MDQCLAAYKLQEYYTVMSSVLVCNRTPCELVAGVRRYALTQLSEHTSYLYILCLALVVL